MKKKYLISGAAVLVTIVMIIILFPIKTSGPDNVIDLNIKTKDSASAAELTKTASASINAVEQSLNLDISALKDTKMSQLQVAEVFVHAGQQVQEGTPLIQLTTDSVKAARTTLQEEILDTGKTYESLRAEQKELRLQVSQTYDNYIANGKYSSAVYDDRCDELQKKTADAKQAVEDKQNEINENLLELTRLQQDLANAQQSLRKAETAMFENYKDRYQNAYYYVIYENTRETAQNMVAQLEEQIRLHTEKNETLLYEVDEAVRAYHQSMQAQEREKLAAKLNLDTETYHSEIATEWRDIQVTGLDNALQEAREHYETALQNGRDFDAYIVRDRILSEHSGFVSDIMVVPGDYVKPDDTLVIFAPPTQAQP